MVAVGAVARCRGDAHQVVVLLALERALFADVRTHASYAAVREVGGKLEAGKRVDVCRVLDWRNKFYNNKILKSFVYFGVKTRQCILNLG